MVFPLDFLLDPSYDPVIWAPSWDAGESHLRSGDKASAKGSATA